MPRVRALELADETTPARTRGNYILRLADAFAADGSLEAARERYREAQRIFAAIPDPERELTALNNLAYSEHLTGDAQLAWKTAGQMQKLVEVRNISSAPNRSAEVWRPVGVMCVMRIR